MAGRRGLPNLSSPLVGKTLGLEGQPKGADKEEGWDEGSKYKLHLTTHPHLNPLPSMERKNRQNIFDIASRLA